MKARISFDLDLSDYSGANSIQQVREVVTKHLIASARSQHVSAIHAAKSNEEASQEEKATAMGKCLLSIKLTLMAEASLDVVSIEDETELSNVLPFERQSIKPVEGVYE